MTTIVMNTLNAAVSEYDWAFQSITPSHAGGATGLFALGGATDAGAPITGEVRSGLQRGKAMLRLGNAFVSLNGAGDGVFTVQARGDTWEYPVLARASGVAKVQPGKGIRENVLGFGYRNAAGADFHLDQIEVELIESNTRRV
jgi:hypothetical protein